MKRNKPSGNKKGAYEQEKKHKILDVIIFFDRFAFHIWLLYKTMEDILKF